MEVLEFDDPAEFRSFVDPLLLTREAENCFLLGITGTLISRPEIYEAFHLWAVSESGNPVGAAAMTPPYSLSLAHCRDQEWLDPLAQHLASHGVDLPGAQGSAAAADRFCDTWGRIRSVDAELEVELGVHATTEVSAVNQVEGAARSATGEDVNILLDWYSAFLEEADPLADRSGLNRAVETRLASSPDLSGTWLWEVEGEPVSLSGYGGRTPNGIRIGPVYTPPAHRHRGYATGLVARQTAWLLAQGRKFCFLFTDMSNPTSNSIYRKIGYRKVADEKRYGFRTSPPSE